MLHLIFLSLHPRMGLSTKLGTELHSARWECGFLTSSTPGPRAVSPWKMKNQPATCHLFSVISYVTSPSRGNTRNVKNLEERKTAPLNLEGYVSASLSKPHEKGKGGCSCEHRC